MLIDTHAHLDFPEFQKDLPSVLNRAHEAGVDRIVTIGIDLESSTKAVRLAAEHEELYATVGVHPHDSFEMDAASLDRMKVLSANPKVLAVGEIGLDYFRDYQPRSIQRRCLGAQLELAVELHLPVAFHIRNAFEDFFEITAPHVQALKGRILHCFSGSWEIARRCLDLGFFLSIPGVVTYPKAQDLHEVVKKAPLDRLLLETDAPYLTPVPFRGKVNEPAYVLHAARKVAELRGISPDAVADATTRNACGVFSITL